MDIGLSSMGRTIGRDALATLLSEVMPAHEIIWTTASGDSYTAEELRRQIESGTAIGAEYASDLLRVARDLLKRKAQRGANV